MSERLERTDFQATSDPALKAGETKLLDYRQLYSLWERQHWAVQDIDFAPDRRDWEERIGPEERYMRMYGLSAFFCGEQRVAAELGPMMRAAQVRDRLALGLDQDDGVDHRNVWVSPGSSR